MALSKTFAIGDVVTAADVNAHLVHQVPVAGNAFDTGWQGLTHASDSYSDASADPAQARRLGNVIYLRGRLQPPGSGTLSNTHTPIGAIPLSNGVPAPSTTSYMSVTCTGGQIELAIDSAGALMVRTRGGGSISVSASSYISLHGVFYVI